MSKLTGSRKATQFTESVIREMTRLNELYGGVNLSQGFPDFPAPAAVKQAACDAITADVNQYAVTWGARPLREAVAREFTRRYGVPVVADEQVTVCCGSTEAMMSTMMAIIDPGDEVVVFEPFYENYGPDAILSGATPHYVTLHEPDWTFDPDELAAAFNDKTRAIIINTPNNPTGKVFSRAELETIGALCRKWDAVAVALGLPDQYYLDLAAKYKRLRDMLLDILERHHFTCYKPYGAYYIMTDISGFGFSDDVEFARYLAKDVGVAGVPGSSFYKNSSNGKTKLRFCYCKREETLVEADRRLVKVAPAGVTLR